MNEWFSCARQCNARKVKITKEINEYFMSLYSLIKLVFYCFRVPECKVQPLNCMVSKINPNEAHHYLIASDILVSELLFPGLLFIYRNVHKWKSKGIYVYQFNAANGKFKPVSEISSRTLLSHHFAQWKICLCSEWKWIRSGWGR